jgi:Cu(I)/Ag(I) efflux system membrane protein CusA/SilA
MGRSPQLVEDQITYPIITSMLAAPAVSVVRGFTMFGMSFVYVIFKDGTKPVLGAFACHRYMSKMRSKLPRSKSNARPRCHRRWLDLQYVLRDTKDKHDLSQIRTFRIGISGTGWHRFPASPKWPVLAAMKTIPGWGNPVKLSAYNISLERFFRL